MTNFGFDKVFPMTNHFVENRNAAERAQMQERSQQAKSCSDDKGDENNNQKSVVSVNSQEEEDLIYDFEELKQLMSARKLNEKQQKQEAVVPFLVTKKINLGER